MAVNLNKLETQSSPHAKIVFSLGFVIIWSALVFLVTPMLYPREVLLNRLGAIDKPSQYEQQLEAVFFQYLAVNNCTREQGYGIVTEFFYTCYGQKWSEKDLVHKLRGTYLKSRGLK